MLLIRNAIIHDAVRREPVKGDILTDNGKIAAIGQGLSAECPVIDVQGKHVYPGFVEAHCHIGIHESAIGFEGNDVNDKNGIVAPELRAIDAIQPMDPAFDEALRAGVTTVCTGPGSASVISGQFCVMKTRGRRVDDMLVKPFAAVKCAFGENPKRVYQNKGCDSRMKVAAKLREMLFKARDYDAKKKAAENDPSKKPAYDMALEALLPVLHGEIPLKVHAHRADDFFTAIRIGREFGVKLTLDHVTEGHLVADILAKEGYPVAVGPTFGDPTKFEVRNKTFATPGILQKAGCRVSIITDSPVTPQKYLPLCAALAIKEGMDEFEALRAITINAAEHAGVADRVGSIAEGKDADLVVCDGAFYDVMQSPALVVLNGEVAVSRED